MAQTHNPILNHRCYLGSLETALEDQIEVLGQDGDDDDVPAENPQLIAFADVAKQLNVAHDSNGLVELRQMIRLILTGD